MQIEIYEFKNNQFGYRIKSKGRILVHSESYDSLSNTKRAVINFKKGFAKLLLSDDKIEIIYLNKNKKGA